MNRCLKSSIALLSLWVIGCGEPLATAPTDDGPAIMVVYQSDPIADVQVKLHESAGGPIIASAITSADGQARFAGLPTPEPNEYFVSLESASDGGWILDTKITEKLSQTLRLKPLAQESPQVIELPSRSIKPLNFQNR